jgi:gluconolactonase
MPDTEPVAIASALQFPEGPVVMADGSIVLTEIKRGTLSRVGRDGVVSVVADLGGGPNGAALGPDGRIYVTNNGGFKWGEIDGMTIPMDLETRSNEPDGFTGGWIDRVDPATGEHTVLYRECDGWELRGPNDLVFDAAGGFWFTDFGKTRSRTADKGFLHYAAADGSHIHRVPFAMYGPNGVGLSPDGGRVYVAESMTGRLLAWDLAGPGEVASPHAEVVDATRSHFDSLAVEADGRVVVAAIGHGLCIVNPDGSGHEYVEMPDPMTTNVCFGGPDRTTAFVTLSGYGRLVAVDWPRPGLALAY